jgi:site-specific DNA-methyltransferase (cytosine-N4-specific)
MAKLLSNKKRYYEPALRPSGHDIGEGFNKDNGGAIPSNLLQIPNTESNSQYLRFCKLVGATGHPARFPAKLPEFFIKFLTDEGDLVLDIFAGSNTTGAVAEGLNRRWLAFDLDRRYLATSTLRFVQESEAKAVYDSINALGASEVDISRQMLKLPFEQPASFAGAEYEPLGLFEET